MMKMISSIFCTSSVVIVLSHELQVVVASKINPSSVTDDASDSPAKLQKTQCEQLVDQLNIDFYNTSQTHDSKDPSYLYSGVMVHVFDLDSGDGIVDVGAVKPDAHEVCPDSETLANLFTTQNDGRGVPGRGVPMWCSFPEAWKEKSTFSYADTDHECFSFLRADIVPKAADPVYIAQGVAKGGVGMIGQPLNKNFNPLCYYAGDGDSDVRAHCGCGVANFDISGNEIGLKSGETPLYKGPSYSPTKCNANAKGQFPNCGDAPTDFPKGEELLGGEDKSKRCTEKTIAKDVFSCQDKDFLSDGKVKPEAIAKYVATYTTPDHTGHTAPKCAIQKHQFDSIFIEAAKQLSLIEKSSVANDDPSGGPSFPDNEISVQTWKGVKHGDVPMRAFFYLKNHWTLKTKGKDYLSKLAFANQKLMQQLGGVTYPVVMVDQTQFRLARQNVENKKFDPNVQPFSCP